MKALIIHGPNDLRYDTVEDVTIKDSRDIVVRMKCCGICGSDLHFLHGSVPTERPVFGIGHEAIGEVVEKGKAVTSLKIGDMVMLPGATGCGMCRSCLSGNIKRCETRPMQVYGTGSHLEGCQAEGIRVPAGDFNATRIPEGISDEQAILLTDNLPTAYGACVDAGIAPGKSVAVIGLGPIGLIAVELAFVMGATVVYAVDLLAERRAHAAQLGAVALDGKNLVETVREQTGGRMIDCIVEAVGGDATMTLALAITGVDSRVAVLGVNTSMNFKIPIEAFINGVTIRGNFVTEVSKHWNDLIPLLQSGRIRPERVFTDRGVLSDGLAAYQKFGQRDNGTLKTLLLPG